MSRWFFLVFAALSALLAAPAGLAGNLDFFEASLGAPGVTAEFPNGTAFAADIDFDADSAEGGGLFWGASEIEFRPTGSVVFVDFNCELQNCFQNVDYQFIPGNQSAGAKLVVTDSSSQPMQGIRDLGTLVFDSPENPGSTDLVDCNYTGQDQVERRCSPFIVVNVMPEPGSLAGLLAGAAGLAALARRRGVKIR